MGTQYPVVDVVLEEVQITTDPEITQIGGDTVVPNSVKVTSYIECDDEGIFTTIEGIIPSFRVEEEKVCCGSSLLKPNSFGFTR